MPRFEFPRDGPSLRAFQGRWVGRVPGPLGCLAAIVLCPIGLVVGLVVMIASMLSLTFGRRRAPSAFRPASPESAAREDALRRLVRAMALDDTFTADDARQAGTLVAGGATVDVLLADALERRWIEVRGERLAVTKRGRDAVDEFPIE